ncbi:class I SAM-dependent methyltransferase [Wenzhouxiangella sp. AB-CW3]|uniref:class I SAM-dependent methyltransferase n=1 Tax=Wenzhouxiangella sp. AB-CW3 TaxID=2771012 RepID=UPI00168BBDC6|nr:class I SAM-dependent methyltransferase [Wenzhouxiangella sp. AB-CW3]QOC23648.1 class I SAM-dependent methyltransferase [Wenzhouxiangella sp. AB-CW3]
MKRVPEPELMDAPAQARAYAEADFSEPNNLFVELALSHLDTRAGGRLLDLGCGPGDICLRFARALPRWNIAGLDAGPNMLALARQALRSSGLEQRVEFVQSRLPDHPFSGQFDAVVSNSLLHHLPDPMSLWQSIARLTRPGGFVQVMDLHRPADRKTASELVEVHAAGEPEVLQKDFHNSLLAAWTGEEVALQLRQAGLDSLELTRPSDRHWLVQGHLPQ